MPLRPDFLIPPAVLAAAAAATLALLCLITQVMLSTGALPDRPNERSTHRRVTPRSGGVAIYGAWAVGMAIIVAFSRVGPEPARAGALVIAVVGLSFALGISDDRASLSPRLKLLTQTIVAFVFVALFGAIETAPLPFVGERPLGALAIPLSVAWIVAAMNAFNFMDGTNGLAPASGALMLASLGVAADIAGAPLFAAGAALGATALAGFLTFNFPGGRIFMGDGGSQTIGFLIGATGVALSQEGAGPVFTLFAPLVFSPFLFDAAFTVAHRARRRRSLFSAHREHVYQLLVRLGWPQTSVAAAYAAATGIGAAAAALALTLAPEDQWIAPAALCVIFAAPAAIVFRRAQRAGFLALRAPRIDAPAESAAAA